MNIVDVKNGNFQITGEIILRKGSDYYDILNLAPTNETWDIKNGYKWIYFKDVEIDKLIFYISVCFHHDKLICIDFGFTDKQKRNLSWDDWSEKEELERKDRYEKWLIETIGIRRNFEWGEIGAYFDPRKGGTSIIVKYR